MSGWIKIHRELFDSDIWHDVSTLRLFIYLIGKASHTDGFKYKGMILNKGQWVRSYRKLAEDLSYKEGRGYTKYSLSTIKRCVSKLIESERVNVNETELGTLFTIINYDRYQQKDDDEKEVRTPLREKSELTPNEVRTKSEQDQELKNLSTKELKEDIVENKFSSESPEYILTQLLISKMKGNNPNAKIPKNLDKWIDALEKLHRIDNYTHKQIQDCIVYSQSDDFWKSHILSAPKLRERIPTLILQKDRKVENKDYSRPESSTEYRSGKPRIPIAKPSTESTEVSDEEYQEMLQMAKKLEGIG